MSEVLVETRGLKKYFKTPTGYLHAVDDINLKIYKGKTLGIVGESGCGKSTLGRVILRLIEATAGEVLFQGTDILKISPARMRRLRKEMQIIFQDPYASLNPRKNVFDLIAHPLVVNHVCQNRQDLHNRVRELMEIVGLAERFEKSYPHELDGGRRQRIGVARALALNPELIICDEPVSALDVSIQAQILNLLMDLQDKFDLAYMFITHDLSVVRHISDDIAVMYLGQCIEKASARDLFNNPLHPYTKALLAAIPVPDISSVGKEIETLIGEVKSPIDPPEGCRFAPRCRFASGKCREETPELKEIYPDHFAACRLCSEGGGAS